MNYLFYGELRMMTELTADRSRVLRCAELYVGWGGLADPLSFPVLLHICLSLSVTLSFHFSVCLSVCLFLIYTT